jgi:hypothetical protein
MKYAFLIFFMIVFVGANLYLFDKCFDLVNTKSTVRNLLGFLAGLILIINFANITFKLFKK